MLVHECFFVCHFGGTKNIKKIYIGNIFWPLERFNFYQNLNFDQKSNFLERIQATKANVAQRSRVLICFAKISFAP